MIDHLYAVIMAGGGGTRLWPLSRQARPKQVLRLGSDQTLFQLATSRLQGLIPPERILVVTVADMAGSLQQLVPQIPVENYLLEPAPRGTAAVVGLAAAFLMKKDPQAVMAVLTADHIIENVRLFQQLLATGYLTALKGHLVTLGIHPTAPATGYGYIQRGGLVSVTNDLSIYKVTRFREKPDLKLAQEMVAAGDHDWNSGMFIWQVQTIWKEFQRQMPELFSVIAEISAAVDTPEQTRILQSVWMGIKPQTIDYGIMENALNVVVIPAVDLGWNDVGSWDSLYDIFDSDAHGNVTLTDNVVLLDTENTLVVSETPARLIAAIGVKDLVVVDAGDVIFVCHNSRAQQVREVVHLLKKTGNQKYL